MYSIHVSLWPLTSLAKDSLTQRISPLLHFGKTSSYNLICRVVNPSSFSTGAGTSFWISTNRVPYLSVLSSKEVLLYFGLTIRLVCVFVPLSSALTIGALNKIGIYLFIILN
ncbi:hypothetical protein FM120_31365 [Sphingobacterium faecium PCAi_F2.5]|nr:hypothetical protein FM120_31365 [Sphingobacterium faecium PCAi_F2.5]